MELVFFSFQSLSPLFLPAQQTGYISSLGSRSMCWTNLWYQQPGHLDKRFSLWRVRCFPPAWQRALGSTCANLAQPQASKALSCDLGSARPLPGNPHQMCHHLPMTPIADILGAYAPSICPSQKVSLLTGKQCLHQPKTHRCRN